MKAIILKHTAPIKEKPLRLEEIPVPEPGEKQIRIKIAACGVCHTDLDEIEGRLKSILPVVTGHQIVGKVENLGAGAGKFNIGDRVGIAWINSACGECDFCLAGNENLCNDFKGTGCDVNGGYAEFTVVSEDFAYRIPQRFSDTSAPPLLCAGAIGYRALRLTGHKNGQVLGLFGFGASAHIVIQVVKNRFPNSKVFVYTRSGQKEHQEMALKLGADWVGATGERPPKKLNNAIDFTPVWKPIIEAMKVMEKGGRIVINAIRKENIDKNSLLELDYPSHLWLEKEIKSVANITRKDVEEFLPIAAEIPIIPEVQEFDLEEANEALILLKLGRIKGAGVLKISS
jgi:propanol-preferring alcohol dehydrogenase